MLDYAYKNEFYYQVPDKSDLKSQARRFWVRLAETFTYLAFSPIDFLHDDYPQYANDPRREAGLCPQV